MWRSLCSLSRRGLMNSGPRRRRTGGPPPNLPSLLLIPVWAGLIGAALMLPSPEIVEAAASSGSSTLSGLLDGAAEGAGVFLGAAPSTQGGLSLEQLASKNLDPNLFVPVCRFSDGFYRTAKNSVYSLAGSETYQEYAPLIAGSLLRVRLEFCVLESFVYESIIPFIKARGLSWVFPLKETVETFVAGVVFAVATNLVLIGSTKIVTIFVSYADFFVGLPLRFVFGFTEDRIKQFGFDKNPLGGALAVTAKAGKLVGQASGGTRALVETADVFVGRYLLLTTVGYVILKFLKFKGVLTLESVGVFLTNLVHIFDAPATDTATAAAQAAASLFL
uniref:Uncharacterized protein n=1 Tax=Hemiselmis andersenii TaxID=464988 RepID=A0A7S1HAY3_HEMAN|mmetsp:Transcript_48044/g.116713  ORF Transcript_48044/g.116713 Transcript_48044/m.116713 type:complete len:333 (+) Transcript_48044:245-1243(+)